MNKKYKDIDPQETKEWVDSLKSVNENDGSERTQYIVEKLISAATNLGVSGNFIQNTDYINTIPISDQSPYKGDRNIERKIKSIIRWNAMAMVVRANTANPGIVSNANVGRLFF